MPSTLEQVILTYSKWPTPYLSYWRFSAQYSVSKLKDFISPASSRVGMCINLFRTYVLCNDISIGVLFCAWHRLDRTKKMAGKMKSSFTRSREWVSSSTFKLESEFALVASSYLAGTFPYIEQYSFWNSSSHWLRRCHMTMYTNKWPCFDTPPWYHYEINVNTVRHMIARVEKLRGSFVDKLHNAATRKSLW